PQTQPPPHPAHHASVHPCSPRPCAIAGPDRRRGTLGACALGQVCGCILRLRRCLVGRCRHLLGLRLGFLGRRILTVLVLFAVAVASGFLVTLAVATNCHFLL